MPTKTIDLETEKQEFLPKASMHLLQICNEMAKMTTTVLSEQKPIFAKVNKVRFRTVNNVLEAMNTLLH